MVYKIDKHHIQTEIRRVMSTRDIDSLKIFKTQFKTRWNENASKYGLCMPQKKVPTHTHWIITDVFNFGRNDKQNLKMYLQSDIVANLHYANWTIYNNVAIFGVYLVNVEIKMSVKFGSFGQTSSFTYYHSFFYFFLSHTKNPRYFVDFATHSTVFFSVYRLYFCVASFVWNKLYRRSPLITKSIRNCFVDHAVEFSIRDSFALFTLNHLNGTVFGTTKHCIRLTKYTYAWVFILLALKLCTWRRYFVFVFKSRTYSL